MQISETRKGELAMLGESLISGLFPIISLLSFESIPPLFSLGGSWVFTSIFFLFIVALRNRWEELIKIDVLKDIIWVVLFIGVFYYGLFFFGLQFTSAGNAGIILQMELFFTFLFFNIWKKEALTKEHLFGAGLMLAGTLIIFLPQIINLNFNKGDLIILASTAFPPVGNYFQRKLKKKVSGESIIFLRTVLSLPFIFLLAFVLKTQSVDILNTKTILFLLLNGILILGVTKILWLEAIIRISVTKANALGSIKPLITLIMSFIILKQVASNWQLFSIIPMLLGVYLLTKIPKTDPLAEDA
jgi:drug/metabolite transporter (DMT)-like permease